MRGMRAISTTLQRRAVTLAAVLVFAFQALLPGAAMAASMASATQAVICTPQGAKTILVSEDGAPEKGFAGLPCSDCLTAATAFIAAPELQALPVAYPTVFAPGERHSREPAPRARAPPRPPGQGPPTTHL